MSVGLLGPGGKLSHSDSAGGHCRLDDDVGTLERREGECFALSGSDHSGWDDRYAGRGKFGEVSLVGVPLDDRERVGDRGGQLIENGKKFVEALGVVPGRPDQNQVGVDIEEGRARPRRHRRRNAVGGESFHDEFAFDIRLAGGAVTGEQENRGHATMLSRLAPCTTSEVAPRRGPGNRSRVARLRPPTSPRRCRRGGASSSPR